MLSQTPTPQPAPKSSGDDCAAVVYEPNILPNSATHLKSASLPHGIGTVFGIPLVMSADHQYNIAVETQSNTTFHFKPSCLTAYGANPSCSELGSALTAYYVGMGNFSGSFTCTLASDNGCDCVYPFASYEADTGTWQVSGNVLYFFSGGEDQGQPVTETTFCVPPDGKTFSISGRNGESMFNVKGFRTVTLVPSTM
jgi:hypothetical protein